MQNKITTIPLHRVKDWFQSSIIYASGLKLDDTEWDDNGVFWWVFEDEGKCRKIIKKHINGGLQINSKDLENAIRTIKGMLNY